MEINNIKTEYNIGDMVYFLVSKELVLGHITTIILSEQGYAYEIKWHGQTFRCKLDEVSNSLEGAIDKAVNAFRNELWNDWGYVVQEDGSVKLKKEVQDERNNSTNAM